MSVTTTISELDALIDSLRGTGRCLVISEDGGTVFAEIADSTHLPKVYADGSGRTASAAVASALAESRKPDAE